jgi:hypothetical protein
MGGDPNPFATPEADVEPMVPPGDGGMEERIRREHIGHETSLKTLGGLQVLGGALALLSSIALFAASDRTRMFSVVQMALGLVACVTGVLLGRLDRRARIPGVILALPGLVAVPMGTLISGYFLYLLLSPKAGIILSERYREIIARTPHVKYRTPIAVWIVLCVVLVLLAIFVVRALIQTHTFR